MRTFSQLTLVEREKLYLWRNQGISFREIGRRLQRDHAGLIKEWKRNRWRGKEYLPANAQLRAEKKSLEQRRKAPLKSMHIWLYVHEHLRAPYYWTPEQIAGRLSVDYPTLRIHHETIYRYIYAPKAKQYKLWRLLPNARKKRMKKGGRSVQRASKIPNAASIEQRPKAVEKRSEFGHWETDNMIGRQTDRSALSVTVERKSRYSILSKLKDRSASTKTAAVMKRLTAYVAKTLTADNGAENTNHQEIASALQLLMYFCHAYHSWEKGTVENTNGRIRRFLPKGVSMDDIPEETIKSVEYWLNNTPRKCLQFKTPYEKMRQVHTSP